MKRFGTGIAMVAMLLCATTVRADVIAFDTGTASGTVGNTGTTGGYQFIVTSPIEVGSLLLIDAGPLGFNGINVVSIYNDNGSSTPVPNLTATFFGTAQSIYGGDNPSNAVWREFNVQDTVLPAGNYVIAWSQLTAGEPFGFNVNPIVPGPDVAYGEARSANGVLVNPTGNTFGLSNAYFGPNFTIIPVPAAAWLAAPLLGGLLLASRKRRAA